MNKVPSITHSLEVIRVDLPLSPANWGALAGERLAASPRFADQYAALAEQCRAAWHPLRLTVADTAETDRIELPWFPSPRRQARVFAIKMRWLALPLLRPMLFACGLVLALP